jgi:hypothetical protein
MTKTEHKIPERPQVDVLAKLRAVLKDVPDVPSRPLPDELGVVLQKLIDALRGVR